MNCYFHPKQLEFHPKYEWCLGTRIRHPESTQRANSIQRALKKRKDAFNLISPMVIPFDEISKLHSNEIITLYRTALAIPEGKVYYPNVFPQRMNSAPNPTKINHAGFYCFDSGTPLDCHTFDAACWSAASAVDAANDVLERRSHYAYALSRPPGHHASFDTYGGYCYFNNACLAAEILKQNGKVVILDIDYHHGNGIQDFYYSDPEVLYISIHGDPKDYFPYFRGYPEERGDGDAVNTNLNIILPDNASLNEYLTILQNEVLDVITDFNASTLIISAGFDTYHLDPIGKCNLVTEDYYHIGKLLKGLGLPTVIIQEGGYYTKDLGENVVNFLLPFVSEVNNEKSE